MVVQYPHIMTVTTINGVGRDENGDYLGPNGSSSMTLNCRAESSDSDGFISGVDGEKIKFNWIVYMNRDAPTMQIGALVSILVSGILINETIKRFSRGQLNCRVWL